jgi:hypothetical protein
MLSSQEHLPVPTLALNYSNISENLPKELYQFGLSPEDEARQVAEKAWLDGHNQAIVLVPQGLWGDRIYTAFQQQWGMFGGEVIEKQTFAANDSDFSQPLQKLLNIDESRNRISLVRRILGTRIETEPRRRKDIDFIFVAALPPQARQIRPQLKFFYAADLPLYATSHVFSGVAQPGKDRDMDDIVFCDMPWVLDDASQQGAQLWQDIAPTWPERAESLRRLYALGVDSFNIIPHLRRLSAYHFQQFEGQTGTLNLDDSNRIMRQLLWARFENGAPKLLDDNINFFQ